MRVAKTLQRKAGLPPCLLKTVGRTQLNLVRAVRALYQLRVLKVRWCRPFVRPFPGSQIRLDPLER